MRLRIGVGPLVTLGIVLVLGIAGPARAATVVDLGGIVPAGLNAKDQVVGDLDQQNSNQLPHAALWSNGTLTPLPEQAGALGSNAYAINSSGRIAGDSTVAVPPNPYGSTQLHALFWDGAGAPSQIEPQASTGGYDFSQADGVDTAGDVAGFITGIFPSNPPLGGFLDQGGALSSVGQQDVASNGGSGFTPVSAITPDGSLLLGRLSTQTVNAFYLWSGAAPNAPGVKLDLTPPGSAFEALAGSAIGPLYMNDLASDGTVLGYKDSGGSPNVRKYYIRLPSGAETQITGLAGPNAVNAKHVVAGVIPSGGTGHAAIWQNGVVTDLNTLLPANSGYLLFDALAINDNGDIAGIAEHNGHSVGFLLKLGIEAENVEITQGIQNDSWDTPTTVNVPAYGATNGGAYTGVPLVTDVPTVVRVYASAPASQPQPPQGLTAELHAYVGHSPALSELADSPISASPRTLAAGPALPQARLDPAGAYTFTLPQSWTERGPLTLVADVNPAPAGTPPCVNCGNVYALTDIPFTDTGAVTVRPFQITYKYPNASGHGSTTVQGPDLSSEYQRARDLLPLAPGDLVVQPYPQAVLDITPGVRSVVHFWRANHVPLSKADLSDCVQIPACRGAIEAKEYAAIHQSVTLSHTGHTYLVGFQPGIDGATWQRSGVTIIGGPAQPPRPLTYTAHELLHLLGFQHAGQGCPGTGAGASQQGVAWPPDDMGYIQGVGLDRRPNSGGTGLYKIIAPGVGQPQWYDLMSYCAHGDARAWLSTVNWSKFIASDPAGAAPAANTFAATSAATGRITVDAALVTGGPPMLLGASSTTSPATPSTASPYHIKALGSSGQVIANVGVSPQQIEDSPLMMLTATLPAGGATKLELTRGSLVLAAMRRPMPLPSVRLVLSHGRLKAAHHRLTIRWRARGARGVTLTAAIQYLASARLGYQTLAAGITAPSYSVPISMFAHATRIHIRIVINDGFSTAIATSALVNLPRR
jgi:uncharacterized membrane protein